VIVGVEGVITGQALAEIVKAWLRQWPPCAPRAAGQGSIGIVRNRSFLETIVDAAFSILTPSNFRRGASAERLPHVSGHESPRRAKLYDRTKERFTQDEVERIRL